MLTTDTSEPKGKRTMNYITFHVPPENQGQIVEVTYAARGDVIIQRVYDSSDGSLDFYISKTLKGDQGDYWNGAPGNKRWRKMRPKELQRHRLEVNPSGHRGYDVAE